jgi:hypothetical protein
LRLIASYNAFDNDIYLAPGTPRRRNDILPKVLDAMGKDGFRDVILHRQENFDNQQEESRLLYNEYAGAEKVSFHHLPLAEQLKEMNKDDWHNLLLELNYDSGESSIGWLIGQRNLDKGSAIRFVMESELLGDMASSPQDVPIAKDDVMREGGGYYGLVYRALQYIIDGYYTKHEFAAFEELDDVELFEPIRAKASKTGGPRFTIPQQIFSHRGERKPQPRYAFDGNNVVEYDFEYWKTVLRGKL